MKNIKDLKPYFRDLESDYKAYIRTMRKSKALEKWAEQNIPFGISGTYSFSNIGESCIRLFIYLDKDDENSTINMIRWLPELKKKRFVIEKFWREEEGYYSYRIERRYGDIGSNSFMIFFESTANIDGCVITKKRKMKYIYETDCEKERVIM